MRIPTLLRPGERVGLIAASGAVPPERVAPAVSAVAALGFEVVTGASVRLQKSYLAGSDEERANDINAMFSRPDIRGIFAMRGGYGAARLMELLDFDMIRRHPKFFAGYSDVTALHTVFNKICGFMTFHTPMPATELYLGADGYTEGMLRRVISGGYRGRVLNPPCREIKRLRGGSCKGRLVGGNLATIVSGLGTPYEIDADGAILLLEEVTEPPYRIDRMLTQLRLSGKLNAAAGIALGYFTDCGDESELLEIFGDILPADKPVLYNLAVGHSTPAMSLALGARYAINADTSEFICL